MKSRRTKKPKSILPQPASESESAGGVSKMPVQRDSPVEPDREAPEKFRSTALNMRAEMSQSTPVLQGFFSSYFDKQDFGGLGRRDSGKVKEELDYTQFGAGGAKIDFDTYKLADSDIGHKDAFSNDYKGVGIDSSNNHWKLRNHKDDGLLKF